VKNGGGVKSMEATTDLVALRAHLAAAKRVMMAANTTSDDSNPVVEEDRQIPMRDGDLITVRIYTPKQRPAHDSPVLVMYHGGGYCLGGLDNEALLCRKWAAELGGVSVNVEYRLAPEHPFPVGVHDAFDALKWVFDPSPAPMSIIWVRGALAN
jgi:acetyl esterase/lipase